jgi:ribonuclease D
MPYVLAASLLAITIFGASQLIPSNDRELESGTMASVDNQNSKPENQPPSKDLELVETEQAKQELQLLKAKIELLEIERLKTELAMLEQLTGNQLSENEVESMIMALAPEYSIPLGGKKADVQSEMARVLMEYPNTRGAFFANKILKQIN